MTVLTVAFQPAVYSKEISAGVQPKTHPLPRSILTKQCNIMTRDRLDKRGNDSSDDVSIGNLTEDVFQEPQQVCSGSNKEI